MKTPITYLLAVLFAFITLHASGANYYVDPSSSGSNQGTFTDPWKNIADIPWTINYFQPGDTVFFKRGQQYTGTLSVNSSGSNGAPIVFMPYGSGNAPLFRYDLANNTESLVYNRVIIRLNQVNHIVIDGFELTDATIPENDHNVTANVGYGVYIYKGPGNNGSHNIIKNLTISKLGSGISIDGGSYNTITDCTIRNLRMILNTPGIMWDDFGAMGIMVGGSDNTITRNHIQDCWSNSYDYVIDGGAIEMYGPVCNNKVLYNTAIENLGWMEFGSGTAGQALNNIVGYNLLINNGHVFWINTDNVYGLDVRNLQFYNNNIIETHAHRIPDVRNLIGIMNTPTVSNVLTMKNNIFWLTVPINITDPNIQPFNGPQLVHQNNLFHMGGGSIGYNLDASERNLGAGDQLFADISSNDPVAWNYNLRLPSAAIDFGQHTGIVKDFYGQAVPSGNMPDAGIAEHLTHIVLPLQFLSCKGWAGSNGNMVEWVTTTDTAEHFEVEKSSDGTSFKKIAEVSNKPGNGSPTIKYQFIDNDVMDGVQYYRVKVVEPGNTGSYSQIVSIRNSVSSINISVSPNPARDYVYLSIPGNNFSNKEMMLLNMAGIVLKRTRFNEAGSQIKIDVSMLPRGAYVIKLVDYKTGGYQSTIFAK